MTVLIDYTKIQSSTLRDILHGAELAYRALDASGDTINANRVKRLIRSRIAAHADNVRTNRELREAIKG